MTRLLGKWSRLEMRALIRFLWVKNASTSAMSRQHVVKWCHFFQSSRQDVESPNMTGSGQPSSSTTEITMARIGELIQNYRRVTLLEISSELGLSYGSVQKIISYVL
ncbi:histone-lysine N-methyltransferase SETMAR [Trichonephila clavipes]|uniref:Histone-lysine N-methyltransferase SETMAR n=1 Tax=Trichonephila clavipes TaxID=2585209 RepID=A0A8X6WLA1_TRICX|nr:histone-lysine N-methyltransferase SETMAR [Trichonephila clavipes]